VFKFKDNKIYRMPPFLGGKFWGAQEFNADYEARVNDVVGLSFTQTTDGDRLADYLPKGFELLAPELSIGYNQLRDVEPLAGRSYNLVQITVPARFNGKCDRLEGTFPLVIWENNTEMITGGREEDGQPKIYADIEDLHRQDQSYFANVSLYGNTFLRLEMEGGRPIEGQRLEQAKAGARSFNVFGYRVIPKVGAPGVELSQPILYPQGFKLESLWEGSGTVQWIKQRPEQNPRQWDIIEALAELPVKATAPVTMTKGAIIMKPFAGRVLE
jgi:acetoacetate decarboxylase